MNISYHITGYQPPRELTSEEIGEGKRDESSYLVSFENVNLMVYGDGFTEADVEDAAREFLNKKGYYNLGTANVEKMH